MYKIALELTPEEMALLYRYWFRGMNFGDRAVRDSLEAKLIGGNYYALGFRALKSSEIIDGKAKTRH